MATGSPKRRFGATAEPEVEVEQLDSARVSTLGQGFALEDVALDGSSGFVDVDAGLGTLMNVSLVGVELVGSRLRGVHLRDVVAEALDGSNANWAGAELTRVVFKQCRLTGMELPESELRDVVFSDCKLDYVSFRMAKLTHVTFDGCLFDDTDFSSSTIALSRFADCRIRNCDLSGAKLADVDLRGSELGFRGVRALEGAVITSLQLMDIAGALAQELGIEVTDA